MSDINEPCPDDSQVFPCKFLRTDLGFASERQRDASRAWVQSVVDLFAEWDVDLIKFDFLHPKAWLDGDDTGLPAGYSNANDVQTYHDAIANNTKNKQMWLLESYNLDISADSLMTWRETGDSYRITTDINNSPPGDGTTTLVSWFAIQRAAESMRIYITDAARPLRGYPDLDSLIIGNSAPLNQLTNAQRITYMSLWIVTGVPIYLADDLTRLDLTYKSLLTNTDVLDIHDKWTSLISPAFFINPDGSSNPSQMQIWEAGPFGDSNEIVVLLANLGCKENDRFDPPWSCVEGKQKLEASWDVLRLQGEYCIKDVWAAQDVGNSNRSVERELDGGESVVLRLTPLSNGAC